MRESFDRAAASYDQAAVLQRQVGDDLLREFAADPEPASILDAGCGTGYGLQILHRRWPTAEFTAVDFAPAMLALARPDADFCLAANIEALPCQDACFTTWWSNLTVQWCDVDKVCREARRVLRSGGQLALSTVAALGADEIPSFALVQRWRYARTHRKEETEALVDPDARLVVAGDYLGDGRIESAYESGLLAADHVLELLRSS